MAAFFRPVRADRFCCAVSRGVEHPRGSSVDWTSTMSLYEYFHMGADDPFGPLASTIHLREDLLYD